MPRNTKNIEPTPARLLAISIAILLVVATAFFIVIQSFNHVRLFMQNDVQDNIEIITHNSELGRSLISLEADIHSLMFTFLRQPELLEKNSNDILARLDDALNKSIDEQSIFSGYQGQVLLGKFRDVLQNLLKDCTAINTAVAKLDGLNDEIFTHLNIMEENTGKLMMERTLAGMEYKGLNQIYALIPYCREQVMQFRFVVEHSISLRKPDLLGAGQYNETRSDSGTALVLNFKQILDTLTSSDPQVSSHAEILLLKIPPYMTQIRHLRLSLESLIMHHDHLEALKGPIVNSLDKIDKISTESIHSIKASTTTHLKRTTIIIYAVFIILIIISSLGWMLIRIRTREMINAMSDALESKESLEMKNLQLQEKITEKNMIEQALRESENRYRDLFENASDLIQILSPEGRFLYVNRAWREILGYSEVQIKNMTIFDIIHPDHRKHCMDVFQKMPLNQNGLIFETTLVARDGHGVLVEGNANLRVVDGKAISTRCILRDITEKRKMQEEIFKARRIESIGVLASGIAHDFNNLLTAIIGNISLAKIHVDPTDKIYEKLIKTEKASLRAQDLTAQLLTFSQDGAPVTKTTSIRELVSDSAHFALSGSNVRCHFSFPDDLRLVEVDEGQIGQVIQNLVTNSDQAMPEGGDIFLSAENVVLHDVDNPPLPDGEYVKLTIRDQGPGIARENHDKVFDPYFSTKESGHGLGLAVSYSILKKHRGHITLDPSEKGAVFSVYLPASTQRPIKPKIIREEPLAGRGRILLMDDEEVIREISGEMLTHMGYDVELAQDGEQTIELYQKALEEKRPFDVVIMDLTIPGGMGGKEAIYKLREIDPQVKAIVSSGYAKDPVMNSYRDFGFIAAVPKPYKLNDLSQTLHQLFNEPA